MNNPFRTDIPLFNDEFILVTIDNEFRMSHWVKGFGIVKKSDESVLIPFNDSYNLEKYQESGTLLQLTFCRYTNPSKIYEVVVDLFNGTFVYQNETFSLKQFEQTFCVD